MEIVESLEKTIKLAEDISDIEFEELKAEVMEDTDNNEHTAAVIAIANYYNMPQLDFFLEIKKIQDDPMYQGLTVDQVKERLDKTHEMFDELKDIIGEEKAMELYSCL